MLPLGEVSSERKAKGEENRDKMKKKKRFLVLFESTSLTMMNVSAT